MITRRSLLRSTAGATSLAAGGMAVTATPSAASQPDAELIALGAEFDELFIRWKPLLTASNDAADAFLRDEGRPPRGNIGSPAYDAWWQRYSAKVDGVVEAANLLSERMDEIVRRMHEVPAVTLAGFAIKARTLRFNLGMWGDNPEPMSEWDWDDECLERFIHEIEAAAGGPV